MGDSKAFPDDTRNEFSIFYNLLLITKMGTFKSDSELHSKMQAIVNHYRPLARIKLNQNQPSDTFKSRNARPIRDILEQILNTYPDKEIEILPDHPLEDLKRVPLFVPFFNLIVVITTNSELNGMQKLKKSRITDIEFFKRLGYRVI